MLENVIFDPPFPKEYIIGAGVLLAVLTVLNYLRENPSAGWFRRTVLAVFRLAVIIGLTIVLMRPMMIEPQLVREGKPIFTVMVDTSESMNTRDTDADGEFDENTPSRLEAVTSALDAGNNTFLRELRQDYDVQVCEFSDSMSLANLEELLHREKATGPKTDIATALMNVTNMAPQREKVGVLLVSDGRDNLGGDAARAAAFLKPLNIPVWTTTVGTTAETKDLQVAARLNQSFLFAKQLASLNVDVSQAGYTGWYARVELFREGKSMGVKQIKLKSGSERISFPIKEDTKGAFQYTVEATPLRGEMDTGNNRRSVFVRVVDDKSRVLLVEAKPDWESKFLLRALQADPNLQVTSIFFIKPGKSLAITEKLSYSGREKTAVSDSVRMPRTKDELFQYDCVILGRGIDSLFTSDELNLFKDYLEERGGSLVFARGKSYFAQNEVFAQLEALVWDEGAVRDARFHLTSAGAVNPIFDFGESRRAEAIIRELPEMVSITRVKQEKSLAVVLAKSGTGVDEMATIAYQRYGKGKVMTIASAGLWKWAFMPEKLSHYDEVYAKFWGQMIRWLMSGSDFLPGQDITFRTEKSSYNLGETVPLVIQTKLVDAKEYKPKIEIVPPSGEATTVDVVMEEDGSGFYTSSFLPEEQGEYEAVLHNNIGQPTDSRVRFTVYSDSVERRFVASDSGLMARVAQITGGEALTIEDWGGLPGLVRDFNLASVEEVKPEDIWDSFKWFSLIVALLTVEWFLRRRAGLV